MSIFLLGFAVLMIVIGIVILVNPNFVMAILNRYADSLVLYVSAILVRLVVGIVLLFFADQSNFPLTLAILGYLFITAALVIAAMGRDRLKRLIYWVFGFMQPYARIAGFLAVCFGGFITYAVL